MKCKSILLVFLALAGCSSVQVGQHITAKNYARSPQRVFVINRLDSAFEPTLPGTFSDAIVKIFTDCHVVATVYQPSDMTLDAEASFKRALDQFQADAVLNMQQIRRVNMDGETRAGTYVMTLTDIVEKRQVWRAVIGMGASTRMLADRSKMGGEFADQIARTMAADAVLKTCPPFPPKTGK